MNKQERNNKVAIGFLTCTPHVELIRFANEISSTTNELDVYIIIDDNTYEPPQSDCSLHFIQVDNNQCVSNGYRNSLTLIWEKECLAWDKALYYFCRLNGKTYDFVWLVEEDVFIPSVHALIVLNGQCCNQEYDLVCQRNHYNLHGALESLTWRFWFDAKDKFPLPWYHSMICAVGLSRRLLIKIDEYVTARCFLPFIEYFFNTIAMHEQLHVYCPPELSTINYRHDWILKEIRQSPMNWYHPIKDMKRQQQLRERLLNSSDVDDDDNEPEQKEYEPDCFCLQPPNI
ncbi:unnamed protein product [Rotaria sordida]|uniref:Uncharacterized protein n=2 Tax=Rotaria sordida TaxID=392033 RepID=A0A814RLL8_9BILA|nr:unnamed protein product [Rotaria sordida]CAF3735822.1 unnamed protein product [Rotaria sordida]